MRPLPSEALSAELEKALRPHHGLRSTDIGALPKTGTTALAIRAKGGVVVAADRQVTAGGRIFERHYQKVDATSPFSAVTYAGVVAFIQIIVDEFRKHLRHYYRANELMLPLHSQANVMKAILRRITFWSGFDIESVFILAGYDIYTGEGLIYAFDPLGGIYRRPKYEVVGSGKDWAQSMLDEHYAEDMEPIDAARLALTAIRRSGHRDAYTGEETPFILMITKEGAEEVRVGPLGGPESDGREAVKGTPEADEQLGDKEAK